MAIEPHGQSRGQRSTDEAQSDRFRAPDEQVVGDGVERGNEHEHDGRGVH